MSKPWYYAYSICLAGVSAAVARAYALVLHALVHFVWVVIPSRVLQNVATPLYTLFVCTAGGGSVALLAAVLPKGYGVGNWITDTAERTGDRSPCAAYPGLPSLVTVVVLTLLNSTCGFSLGPEGPMVCAGGILGNALCVHLVGASVDPNDADRCAEMKRLARAFSITGAAAALSSFLGGMPLVGAVFATELLGPSAALGGGDGGSPLSAAHPPFFSSAVAASIVAAVVADASKSAVLGGDFDYAFGRDPNMKWNALLIIPAVAVGMAGGALSSAVTHGVKFIRSAVALFNSSGGPAPAPIRRVAVCSGAGFVVGVIGILFPYTLLWGETRLEALLKLQPFDSALDPSLNAWAIAGRCPELSEGGEGAEEEAAAAGGGGPTEVCVLSSASALAIGVMKLVSISVAVGVGLPGGVIFPLFFAAAALAKGGVGVCELNGSTLFGMHVPWFGSGSGEGDDGHELEGAAGGGGVMATHDNFGPVATVCLMAALQAATTRTPLATVFMLAMASAPSADNTAALLPAMATGAYVGVWTAEVFEVSFFEYPK